MHWIKDSLTLLFTLIAVGSLVVLLSAAAGAQTKTGWQIHVTKAGSTRALTIGPPFPTKQVCEDVRFPVMIQMISDRVECLPVADHWNKD